MIRPVLCTRRLGWLSRRHLRRREGDGVHAVAMNGKLLRIGLVILIVDADTIMPEVTGVAYMHFHSCLFLTPRVKRTGRAVYAMLPWNWQGVPKLPLSSTVETGQPHCFGTSYCRR